MKRMFTVLSVLSFALVMTVAAFGKTPSAAQPKPEHLSKQQLQSLIATAKTPAEHERIAQYYKEQALDYLAQAKEHQAMVAAYKANSNLSNDRNRASTISHCEYFVTTFEALADNSQELGATHERMAQEAPVKLNPTGK
jgi:hypothetical protein